MPVGVSSADFWRFFDALPQDARDQINYALNGPAVRDAYGAVLAKYYRADEQ